MRGDRRLAVAIGAVASVLAGWIVLWASITWYALEPAQRAQLASLSGTLLPMLVLAWLFAVIGLAAGLRAVFRDRMLGPARLLERARVLLSDGGGTVPAAGAAETAGATALPKPSRASISGSPELRALAEAIEALAGQRDALGRDIAAQVGVASRGIAQERNRLAALMAELTQSVIACTLDGRILLYNPRARQQFRALSDAPGVADGAELIGIGRSIHALLERERLDHALDTIRSRIARHDPDPSTQFVTTTHGGQLLRVQMAPVRTAAAGGSPAGGDDALAGFLLVLENVTTIFEDAARRDQLLLQATEHGRASLLGIHAALDRLEASDAARVAGEADDDALRTRQYALARGEIDAMRTRIDALAQATSDAIRERWPLEPIEAGDLLVLVAAGIGRHCDCRLDVDAAPEASWLRVDGFGLGQAIAYLAKRVVDEFGVRTLRLRFRRDHGPADEGAAPGGATPGAAQAHLELAWSGRAMSTETVMTWELDPMRLGATSSPLTVRDVVSRHGGQLGFVRDRARHEACLRLSLPLDDGRPAPAAPLSPTDARPEYFDFDLFDTVLTDAALDERPLAGLTFTVFDTETTGLEPAAGDQIIQIGAARIVNGRIRFQESFEQLVDPGRTIPPASIPIHGITPEMVAGKPRIAAVLPAFHRFAEDSVLVAHNAAFDMRFLQLQEQATGIAFRQPVLDTLLLSAVVHPNQASHRLDEIAERFGIRVVGRHTALGDALVTAQVLLRLIPLLEAMGIRTLREAREASQKTWYARLAY
ncbi:MAG: exonuclease domain-containing protein [Lautropia sp.]